MLQKYLSDLNRRLDSEITTEHTFRGDLQFLIEGLLQGITVISEPKMEDNEDCGKPDIVLKNTKKSAVGYIETKDIGDKDLQGLKVNKEQFDRYKKGLGNIIFTDYLDFYLYREGIFVSKISIGQIQKGVIVPLRENFAEFEHFLKTFSIHKPQTIKSSKRLAELMAGKARLLSDVIEKALNSDYTHEEDSSLKSQMKAFQKILIHDITAEGFADIYAQTITYGMFAARLHDPTLPTFSRQEASELIPKSNPFLSNLFGYIAGKDLDKRLVWIVEDLVEIFLACDVDDILKNYGRSSRMEDPIIHFYEDFLSEYDPALRKARGVWYTPKPVVNFIVRAVDDILKTEFHLPKGLSDTSMTVAENKTITKATPDKRSKIKEVVGKYEIHKVQILDPATGTGTFLAEVIKQIHRNFKGQEGIWNDYVEKHLIPRLNGFEILMASYAMAHLQLDLLLTETGFKSTNDKRLNVFLTNSLEEYSEQIPDLFSIDWLSKEANDANKIKQEMPIMCVIGNPPYSGESVNKGEWIMNLMEDYKKEPEGKEKLKERNPKWINDDYVKFLRYAQHYVERTGTGIVAFINPHGFLDNPTFRGMRWNLLKTYDKIYTIDLHGNSKKKEIAPDGSADVNVFDIMQGVSINIFVKTGTKKTKELGKVFHFDLFGKREMKYDFLIENSLKTIKFKELPNIAPNYFFVGKDFEGQIGYDNGFSINVIFGNNSIGFVTAKDSILVNNLKKTLLTNVETFYNIIANDKFVRKCSYRPFDEKFVYFDSKIVERSRIKIMQQFLIGENIGLLATKAHQDESYRHAFITNTISEAIFLSGTTGSNAMNFPLYIYPDQLNIGGSSKRKPNLNLEIVDKISKKLGLKFIDEKEKTVDTFAPIDVLDYIYAVLHSPNYREKYKEFLKIDFPKVPYPKNVKSFWILVKLGGEIRKIHLLENPIVDKYITEYPKSGNNTVQKPKFVVSLTNKTNGSVYINETQFFANVPIIAWNFYIGGYQPAQKWLKDRKERVLSFEDIQHYQKIIVALSETAKLMQEIDLVGIE